MRVQELLDGGRQTDQEIRLKRGYSQEASAYLVVGAYAVSIHAQAGRRQRQSGPCAGLDGGVVGDDDGGASFDFADAGCDARGAGLSIVFVVGDEEADFGELGSLINDGVEKMGDVFAAGEFAGAVLLFDFLGAAAFAGLGSEVVEGVDEMAHVSNARLFARGVGGVRRHPGSV